MRRLVRRGDRGSQPQRRTGCTRTGTAAAKGDTRWLAVAMLGGFVTLASGRALFVPSSYDLSFTFPGGSEQAFEIKGNGHPPAPDTCAIAATVGDATVTGTATGKLVTTP